MGEAASARREGSEGSDIGKRMRYIYREGRVEGQERALFDIHGYIMGIIYLLKIDPKPL